jgi:hypothetical protein
MSRGSQSIDDMTIRAKKLVSELSEIVIVQHKPDSEKKFWFYFVCAIVGHRQLDWVHNMVIFPDVTKRHGRSFCVAHVKTKTTNNQVALVIPVDVEVQYEQ